MTVRSLREKHPRFIYERYGIEKKGQDLIFQYFFTLEPNIHFSPKVKILNAAEDSRASEKQHLENFAFHLGLAEIPSYWKASCSPKIVIRAGFLSPKQIQWWNDLLIQGLGEFFYTNKIDFTSSDFVQWESDSSKSHHVFSKTRSDRTLVPVGGGKDSVVTLELLKQQKQVINAITVNPSKSSKKILSLANIQRPIVVEREIDLQLLELNKKGYLNGHTPFSSYIAFLSTVCAALFDYRHVALSNEHSSSEGNVNYLGLEINHQYSKSFAFERAFRDYASKHLASTVEYFSFLRPLYEIQIAKLFSEYPQYLGVIRSCNSTEISEGWCCRCPKCLFVFTILYIFIDEDRLTNEFGSNLFEDKGLETLAKQLLGATKHKPFECVGTTEENKVAFYLAMQKHRQAKKELPPLLKDVYHTLKSEDNLKKRSEAILDSWNKTHLLPDSFQSILKAAVAT